MFQSSKDQNESLAIIPTTHVWEGERLEGGGVEGQAEVGVEAELLSSSMGLYS